MNTQATITEILPRIEVAIQRVLQAVAAMPPALINEPRLAEGRSVKDVLAHLMWWDQWLLITLPPAPGEPPLAITLPLADQIPATKSWYMEMNDKVHLYNQPRPYVAIWKEFTETLDHLRRRVAQLTDQDLTDPAGISAVIGQPLAPLICGIYEHYEEHAHEFEKLIA